MLDAFKERFFATGEAEGVLIHSPCARRYLTGFASTDGVLLITPGESFLFLDFRYTEAARRVVKNCRIVEVTAFDRTACSVASQLGLKSVAVEYEGISFAHAMRCKDLLEEHDIRMVSGETPERILLAMRSVKTPEEISAIEAAQKITDQAFSDILNFIRPGVTEKRIAAELEYSMRKNGADGFAFDTIVVSGENGSLCHGEPSDRIVRPGDLVTMDFGAVKNGYHSDMTRTVAVGHVTEEQRHVYALVLKAQQAALSAVREGVACSHVDQAARELIEAEYSGAFGHGTGHGVGLEIHEEPRFSPSCSTIAQAGMVLSVEPGIYLAGRFGVRIEDLVVVTKTGCKNLTHSEKNLIIL